MGDRPAAGRQLGFFWGGLVLALVAFSPLAPRFAGLAPACPLKTWTGLPCPSCGTTRAALALSRFEFFEAFTHYPLQSVAWTVFLLGGLWAGWLAWRGRPLPALPRRLPGWVPWAALLALAGNWAYSIVTGV